jgi:hypothetical protein
VVGVIIEKLHCRYMFDDAGSDLAKEIVGEGIGGGGHEVLGGDGTEEDDVY